MKFAFLPIISAVVAVMLPCCETPEQDNTVTATITAGDVTVEEGQTARISASTNSSSPITFTSADPTVATVSPSGDVSGVKAGSTTLTLAVAAVEGKFTAAEKTVNVTVTAATPPDNPDGPDTPEDDGKPKPGTYTFTASPLKGQWKAGDQIYIQGGYGPAAQVITLSAGQISSDGTTASADLSGDLFRYLTTPDPLYAVWPADAVKKEDGLTNKLITFTVSDILLTQAYLVDNGFEFADVSSFISFTVSGGYDRFIIAGKQRPGLRYSSNFKNEYSSAKKTPNKPKDDGYPYREEQLIDGSLNTIYFPGGMNFQGGFTMFFAKGDSWTASYTYSEDANLKGGKKLELGDISAQLVPYSGPKPHMPEVVKTTKYTVSFNELSGICADPSGDFVWAVGDGSEICQVSVNGELLHRTDLFTFNESTEKAYTIDSEGLSINYDTGDLLISGEPNAVCYIPAEKVGDVFTMGSFLSKNKNSSWSWSQEGDYYRIEGFNGARDLFKIADASNFGNSGAEGCTYYKDNLVYVGTQTGSYLYLCDLSTGEVKWRKGLREMFPVITEIAGLCYDPLTDWLWVIDSESHKFFALTGDAEQLLGAYTLKTSSNEESISVDHKNQCVWVGDDYGSTSYIYKYELSGLDDFIISE